VIVEVLVVSECHSKVWWSLYFFTNGERASSLNWEMNKLAHKLNFKLCRHQWLQGKKTHIQDSCTYKEFETHSYASGGDIMISFGLAYLNLSTTKALMRLLGRVYENNLWRHVL